MKDARVERFFLFGIVAALLAGCSPKPPAAGTTDGPPTSGTTVLVKRPGGPLWNIEYVGPVLEAYKFTSFEVPSRGELTIGGWAVDQDAHVSAGRVEMRIDGMPYAAEYGQSRPDVANVLKQASYTNSGWILKVNAEQFSKAAHTVYFRVFANDSKSYWEAGPFTISFK